MMQLTLNQLPQLCEHICDQLSSGGVVVLQGDLASGKTTFTQAFSRFLGIDEAVTSPTFSLQQKYGEKLFHYDLYNYGFEKFLSMGMLEELEKPGYHLIEWGDEALIEFLKKAGFGYVVVQITKFDNEMRCYEVENG
ncbi:MAG: tRNA (adenosine(37)-N6)-threonylcarbamoyltransferase complex ATPase subunit type 1 TsaE [Sulfuricurvum sp.]|jgi:tRNA threonylcarbamoyladenosine biosynthesis protein TsaE|nr:tRNA (adenosine(37)-N6)-threonylcarbamoyltransferase complex ATPase subunit type 1 TsaE [Sulfuricurvum sp.]MDP3021602.1 tRNA (adenosine(37)-N6)-threonylcarbamoyltransferase complex ATPase subunit type 1 TsaE [Sulfuricurvum sp.]MDP3119975.1 tRNA (adenosine(37)-N6)-threonylcarbamoyltransferase complex ATPase subunit type 1 TsaE [Sulfuricurvum sp.]